MNLDDDIGSLIDTLETSSIDEYERLIDSQKFTMEELLLSPHVVIKSATLRYLKYIKYINFDTSKEMQLIRAIMEDFFLITDIERKIYSIKQIDKMIKDEVDKTE